jgi:hypothetical protein
VPKRIHIARVDADGTIHRGTAAFEALEDDWFGPRAQLRDFQDSNGDPLVLPAGSTLYITHTVNLLDP